MVNDASGRAIIDCSTYVGLVMRGVQYTASPYANGAANATVDPKTIRCTSDTWPEAWFDRQADASASVLGYTIDGKYRTLTASDILAYYEALGLAWKAGEREPRAGDLCFMAKANPDGTLHSPGRWRGVTHVGIMTDPTAYLNATDYDSSGDLIRTQVSARAPQYYARPLYGGLTQGATDALTNDLVQLMPVVWSGVKQGASSVNGVSLSLVGRRLTCSGDGTSGFSRDVVSAACPLYLPPGTYRLSGVVNGTGGNMTTLNQYWGLRVYDADSGAGIPGTTWSANGANSQQRTPVWDIGGGGQFSLSAWTRVKVDAYLTGSRAVTGIAIDPKLVKIG